MICDLLAVLPEIPAPEKLLAAKLVNDLSIASNDKLARYQFPFPVRVRVRPVDEPANGLPVGRDLNVFDSRCTTLFADDYLFAAALNDVYSAGLVRVGAGHSCRLAWCGCKRGGKGKRSREDCQIFTAAS